MPPLSEVQIARRNWFRGRGNRLQYRATHLAFEHAEVAPGGHSWPLPCAAPGLTLDFEYEVDGEPRRANQFAERTFTLGLLILKKGRIVTEIYRAGASPHTPLYSASMSKSMCSILMGIAVRDGRIESVEQQVTDYLPELRGSGYDGVSLRQLLGMRSGVNWNDDFYVDGPSKQIQEDSLFDNVRRYTDAAYTTTRDRMPGEHFNYNSLDAAIAGWVVERAVGESLTRYTSEALWKPAAMEAPAYWLLDGLPGVGREFVAGGFNAVLRDYGRIGQMMLDKGVADGRQILPASWVEASTQAPPGAAQPGGLYRYGFFWWLLDGSSAFTAQGGMGQYIYVNPTHDTVIVKASATLEPPRRPANVPEEVIPWDTETQAFFKAAAEWTV